MLYKLQRLCVPARIQVQVHTRDTKYRIYVLRSCVKVLAGHCPVVQQGTYIPTTYSTGILRQIKRNK